ncbi:hypothetical protein BB559_000859 [Furculomyces boomerangus]|uniref:Uncharacterized protein n=1 Tax=Furculomyces boomerangus TaxID=61424 RepID=A0A2T9Z405_9FUNG|nr:hypothetical protein BB559_000859 [Furculomyces boomerangus]
MDGLSRTNSRSRRKKHIFLSPYARKLVNWRHVDFEYATWEMLYLIISPKRVYRNIYYHKQTKNQWSRDDPAFLILQIGALLGKYNSMIFLGTFLISKIVFSIGYGLIHGAGARGLITVFVKLVLVNYILFGVIMACLTWNIHVSEQQVEWHFLGVFVSWEHAVCYCVFRVCVYNISGVPSPTFPPETNCLSLPTIYSADVLLVLSFWV